MTKWMMIFALATLAAASTAACTSDDAESDVQCERVDVEGEDYCLYTQPITETGYDCPQDLANPIEFEGSTVCSRQDEIPEAHRDPVRDELDQMGNPGDPDLNNQPNNSSELPDGIWQDDDGQQAIEALCESPEQFDGQSVEVAGELIADLRLTEAIDCSAGSDAGSDAGDVGCIACANSAAAYVLECEPDSPSGELILLKAGPSVNTGFGCQGSNCNLNCEPAAVDGFASVSGIFRHGEDYYPDFDHDGRLLGTFSMVVEIGDFELSD